MDLLDLAILALRIGLVVVLYAFLLVVLRFAERSLRTAPLNESAQATARVGLSLLVVDGGSSSLSAGEVIALGVDGATLGRTSEADVVVADPAVSANHARISKVGRTWMVSDLASTNGTLVNDARVVDRVPLRLGDVLALGSVRLQVVAPQR